MQLSVMTLFFAVIFFTGINNASGQVYLGQDNATAEQERVVREYLDIAFNGYSYAGTLMANDLRGIREPYCGILVDELIKRGEKQYLPIILLADGNCSESSLDRAWREIVIGGNYDLVRVIAYGPTVYANEAIDVIIDKMSVSVANDLMNSYMFPNIIIFSSRADDHNILRLWEELLKFVSLSDGNLINFTSNVNRPNFSARHPKITEYVKDQLRLRYFNNADLVSILRNGDSIFREVILAKFDYSSLTLDQVEQLLSLAHVSVIGKDPIIPEPYLSMAEQRKDEITLALKRADVLLIKMSSGGGSNR